MQRAMMQGHPDSVTSSTSSSTSLAKCDTSLAKCDTLLAKCDRPVFSCRPWRLLTSAVVSMGRAASILPTRGDATSTEATTGNRDLKTVRKRAHSSTCRTDSVFRNTRTYVTAKPRVTLSPYLGVRYAHHLQLAITVRVVGIPHPIDILWDHIVPAAEHAGIV